MIQLTWWEKFLVESVVAMLNVFAAKITNQVERAAIEATIAFLKRLLGDSVKLSD